MAFPSEITIDTNVYASTVVKPRSTLRSDATASLDAPATLLISHEISAAGRVSSVGILDSGYPVPCDTVCGTSSSIEFNRVMLKVVYDPSKGQATQKDELTAMITEMITFFGDLDNITKFLNQET